MVEQLLLAVIPDSSSHLFVYVGLYPQCYSQSELMQRTERIIPFSAAPHFLTNQIKYR